METAASPKSLCNRPGVDAAENSRHDSQEWEETAEEDQEESLRETAAESLLGLWTINRAQEQSPGSFSLGRRRMRKVRAVTYPQKVYVTCDEF